MDENTNPWAWRMRTEHEPCPTWKDKLFVNDTIPESAERHNYNTLTIVWWESQ